MNALLTNSFSVEDQEGKKLINNITTSYKNQDKEAFLESKILFVEAALIITTEDQESIFNENVYNILQALPSATALALSQKLVQEEKNDFPFITEIFGKSDKIYKLLQTISDEAENCENEEIFNIKAGKAFYH